MAEIKGVSSNQGGNNNAKVNLKQAATQKGVVQAGLEKMAQQAGSVFNKVKAAQGELKNTLQTKFEDILENPKNKEILEILNTDDPKYPVSRINPEHFNKNFNQYPGLNSIDKTVLSAKAEGDAEINKRIEKEGSALKDYFISQGMSEEEADSAVKSHITKQYIEEQKKVDPNGRSEYEDAVNEVNERFGDIEAAHDEAEQGWMDEFESDPENKEPKLPENPTFAEIEEYEKKHAEWELKKDKFLKEKEEEYAKEHPEYGYYKQELEKNQQKAHPIPIGGSIEKPDTPVPGEPDPQGPGEPDTPVPGESDPQGPGEPGSLNPGESEETTGRMELYKTNRNNK